MMTLSRLLRLAVAVVLLGGAWLQAPATAEATNAWHTITVDGNLSDWTTDERLGTLGGISYYATWDADYVYFALNYPGAARTTDILNVAVDTDPDDHGTANSGATSALLAASWPADSDYGNKPDYAIQSASGVITTSQASGGGWTSWSPANSTASRCASGKCAEWKFKKSELGLAADSSPLGVFLWAGYRPAGVDTVYASWPPENRQDTGVFYGYAFLKDTSTGQTPNAVVQRRGAQELTLSGSGAGTASFLNTWVRLSAIDTGGGNCDYRVEVVANGDVTTDVSDFARLVRVYDTQAGGCSAASSTLRMYYDDGDGNGGLGTSNTASELGTGDRPNKLDFWKHAGGATWTLIAATSRSQINDYIQTSGLSLPAAGTSGTYTLGEASPTAITLRALSASSAGVSWPGVGLATAALLAVIALAGATLRRLRPAR